MNALRSGIAILLLTFFCSVLALAQGTGSITGTVRDNTGAVVPGAQVLLTSVEQGTTLTTTSNSNGEYLFAALPAATYNLTVRATGFNEFESKNIVLNVAQKLRI